MVPVSDLDVSVHFFSRVLGFTVVSQMDGYAYIKRDNVGIRLVTALADKDLQNPSSQQHVYIDVSSVDELYSEHREELDLLPSNRLRRPFNTPYGTRELHVIDPDALLISFVCPCV